MISRFFRNRLGEDWEFRFDAGTGLATVAGSDVGWESYPVIEGVAVDLVMDQDETAWLHSIWSTTCSAHPRAELYPGIAADFSQGKRSSFLTNGFCPLCLLQKREFEVHHCIPATDGGPDTASNLLSICNTCHAIITRGSLEDRLPKAQAAVNHQLMHFGVRLYQDAIARPNRRTGNSLLERSPMAREMAEALSKASPAEVERADAQLKHRSRVKYQYMRDLGLGLWPWKDYEERVLIPMQRWTGDQS